MITAPTTKEQKSLLNLWEQSVRKTHLFLAEGDIEFYRPFVNEFIPKLDLHVIRSASGQIEAFMGLSDDHIEMLFVLPSKRKNGLGSRLLDFAIHEKGVCKVDVNEQNTDAVNFYTRRGFNIISRDPTDAFGKPYPILHLEIEKAQRITTERLLMRPFMPADFPIFYRYCNSPHETETNFTMKQLTEEEAHKIFNEKFLNIKTVWAICLNSANPSIIGSLGFYRDTKRKNPRAFTLKYWLDKNMLNKGIMTEALIAAIKTARDIKQISLLTAYCYNDSTRSQQVLKQCNFSIEGTLHDALLTEDGTLKDELCFYRYL